MSRSPTSEEEQAGAWIATLLAAHAEAPPAVQDGLHLLADSYLRLLRKFGKITKISDQVHVQLRELNQKVEERTAELVEAKKMAALGTLVAGVAHEINTPIGTAMTVASTLQRRNAAFGALVESGTLKKSSLTHFVADTNDAVDLLLKNLTRAAHLIGSFKRVAVDQTSSDARPFNLSECIAELMTSLQPHLRRPPVTLSIAIPAELDMVSCPGALGQVITNLTLNAITHAFAGRARGTIAIEAEAAGKNQVRLRFADDGAGMDEDSARRAFDPFFTTRREQGGSGLGLHISYNLVTQTLGGTIMLRSQPGQGTEFEMTLPRVVSLPKTRGRRL